jgi:hypothetical protein
MLSIRKAQMDAFQVVAEKHLINQTIAFLRESYPEVIVRFPDGESVIKEIPDETLRQMVSRCMARAREYGMTWETSLASFVTIAFLVAPNFDDHPLLKRALLDESLTPDLRIEKLTRDATDKNWEAARQSYDPAAWEPKEGTSQ